MAKSSGTVGLKVGMVVSLQTDTGRRELAYYCASSNRNVASFQVIRSGRDDMNKVLRRCVAWEKLDCVEIDAEHTGLHGLLESFFAESNSRRWENHFLAESYIKVSDLETGIGLLFDAPSCATDLSRACFSNGHQVNWERLKAWDAPQVPPSIQYNRAVVKALIAKHGFAETAHEILVAVERQRDSPVFSERDSDSAPRIDQISEDYRLSLRWDAILLCLLWERLMLLVPGEDGDAEIGDAVSEILVKALMIDIEFTENMTSTTDLTHWMHIMPPAYLTHGYEDRLSHQFRQVFREMNWERLMFPLAAAWWSEDVGHVPWIDRFYPILCDQIVERCISEAWDRARFEKVLNGAYAEGNFSAYHPFYQRFIPVFDRLTISMQAMVGLEAAHYLQEDERPQVYRLIRQRLQVESEGRRLAEMMRAVIVEDFGYKEQDVLFQIGRHFPGNSERLTELITALLSGEESA